MTPRNASSTGLLTLQTQTIAIIRLSRHMRNPRSPTALASLRGFPDRPIHFKHPEPYIALLAISFLSTPRLTTSTVTLTLRPIPSTSQTSPSSLLPFSPSSTKLNPSSLSTLSPPSTRGSARECQASSKFAKT